MDIYRTNICYKFRSLFSTFVLKNKESDLDVQEERSRAFGDSGR